jgi:NAD(P)-dependent dehydrogenase (short-subunit alcohol dehydrogenase family)
MTMAERVAFVTGAASGIGLATARLLLAEGWKVAIADRDGAALDKAALALDGGPRVLALPLDITDEAAVAQAVARAEEALGGLDGIVNSAGIAADVPALDTKIDLFRRILDINVTGTFIVAQAGARIMKRRGGGAIVNLASIAGLRGSKGRSAYGASKGAVVTLTQVLANDLARDHIRVNAVAPGPIETPMVKALHTDSDRTLWNRFIPMKRYGTTEEIAKAIAFLLDGEKASYITGEILAVDGGYRGAGVITD